MFLTHVLLSGLTMSRHHSRYAVIFPAPMIVIGDIFQGYHRLWSHRSYNATFPLQVFLLSGGSSAVQGSCYWWARSHRSHHRHTDTDRDPYDSNRGILWTHIGWVLFKSDLRSGPADISDLHADELIQFQHQHYFPLAALFGYVLPIIIPALLWDDWLGGLCFSACFRLTVAHHVSIIYFCKRNER